MAEVRRLIAIGAIGEVRMVAADFGYRASSTRNGAPSTRNWRRRCLDVGVYPISLASMLLGEPERIASMAELGETGVDEQSAMVL